MLKKMEIVFLIFLGVSCLEVRGSIAPEDLPKELKFVLDPELTKYEPPEILSEKLPFYLSGYDSENRAIWVVDIGVWPIVELISKGPEFDKDMHKYVQRIFALFYEDINRRSTPEKPITQLNLILDMDQFNFRKAFGSVKASKFVVDVFSVVVNATPFTNMIMLVNANHFAKQAILFLKPTLGKTFDKLEVFGVKRSSWVPVLLERLPQDQLAPRFGGDKNFKPAVVFSDATQPRIF